MSNSTSPCFNIWAFHDSHHQLVMQVSIRAYVLSGNDEEKLEQLRQLAVTDFYAVERHNVPKKYIANYTGESEDQNRRIEGAIPGPLLQTSGILHELVEFCKPLPEQVILPGGQPERYVMEVESDPLHVLTFVEERLDGTLVPQIARQTNEA